MSFIKKFALSLVIIVFIIAMLRQYDEYIERKKERSLVTLTCGTVISIYKDSFSPERSYFEIRQQDGKKVKFSNHFSTLKRWVHPKSKNIQQILLGMQENDKLCVGHSSEYSESGGKYRIKSPYIFYIKSNQE